MLSTILTALLLAAGYGPAQPAIQASRTRVGARSMGVAAAVTSLSATPGTISFRASDPDYGAVAGNSTATVTWLATSAAAQAWTLSIQAGAASFSACPTVPVSAVTVTCATASVAGGTGACSGPFPLATSPQQVAGGTEAAGSASYTVTLNFTLAESWRYVASQSSCTLTLTYTADAQ